METVIEKIEEIQSMLEREVEWPLTDFVEKKDISPVLSEIFADLQVLKLLAENIEKRP